MKAARAKKLISQSSKKAMKNQAKLPRTAGLRTISELSSELTKAGYDPSRIEERAAVLAKVAGAKRKRAREEEEAQMDVDEEGEEGEEADWMDVDGEDQSTPNKRAKANSGAAVAKGKREPRSDRRLAGMRDSAVRIFGFCARRRDADDVCGVQQASKAIKLRDLGQRRPNMLAKAGESDRAIKVKMV